jgi:PAS domain S-box-containing protein
MLKSLTPAIPDKRLRSRLDFAARLGSLGADARDLQDLFRALYVETGRVMNATIFFFALYDEASETVEVVRQADRGEEYPGGSFPLGKGFTSEVIRTRTPRLVRNWSEEAPVRLLYGTEKGELVTPQSGVIVPILSGEHVLGVLSAQTYEPEAYDDNDLFVINAIASQAGAHIKRLRATEEMALEYERHALELEAVLAAMNDALVIVDERGAITRLNRAARELLRLDSAGLVFGQPLEAQRLELLPVTAREVAAALVPVIAALRTGTNAVSAEVELRAGERRVLSLSGSLLRTSKGTVHGGVVVLRDITGQRELERLREDIFAMAWHDLRTPMTVIRGNAEVLLNRLAAGDRDFETFKKAARAIVTHTDRVAELISTLFDVSTLEAGLLSITRSSTDLANLARDVADVTRPMAKRRIRIVAPAQVIGEWDERRIRQVLTNLMSNAVKYSPEGSEVTVTVTADAHSATVCVRDEGMGLDESELAHLFRRGYRTERARNVKGAGLGLYFAHGLVAAHGGRMWAESPGPDRGSVFSFTLPLDEPAAATAERSA